METDNKTSAIGEFFNGKCIFVTGATGFIGKQIIEKLLRSCPGVDRIYILIRSKRGVHANERLQELCSLSLFDKVRLASPDFQSKIIPLAGDLTKTNLDLSKEDEQLLTETCQIVINSGASIRFADPLKHSIKSNVYSVQHIINICKKIKQLQAFVHISTAYIHCYRSDINEVIYPMNENPTLLLESAQSFDDHKFDNVSNKILKKYPNAYTYTKSLGEYIILQQTANLPVAIIRPSIVGAAWKEPIPGWIDNYGGATSFIIAIGKRLLRVGNARSTVDHPMVPVDTVANMTLAIAWYTATRNNLHTTPTVYNCCSATSNKTCLSLGDFFQTTINEQQAIEFENYGIVKPTILLTMNTPYYYFRQFVDEIIPAYILDLIAILTFRKTKMVKFNRKVNILKLAMKYFCQHQWIYGNQNSKSLLNQMNDIDRQEFNFDLTELNWSTYLRNYCIGIKKYLLKEELHSTSLKTSSTKYLFFQEKKIRRFGFLLFFFTITWFIRSKCLKTLRMIWEFFNRIVRNYFLRNKKKIFYSLK